MDVVRASMSDLLDPPPIEDLIASSRFKIVSYNLKRYNEFDVMSENVMKDEYFLLKDDILESLEFFEENRIALEEEPALKEIVLAPKNGEYHRAIVVSKPGENDSSAASGPKLAQLYFIDCGGSDLIDIKTLKPVTANLMEYPVLAYHIVLDFIVKTDMFYEQHFINLMEKMMKKEFKIELGDSSKKIKGRFTVPRLATLTFLDEERKTCQLSTMINSVLKWDFEKVVEASKGTITDAEICETDKSSFASQTRFKFQDSTLPHTPFPLKIGDKFVARLSRIFQPTVEDVDFQKPATASITLLETEDYVREYDLLHGKLEQFCEAVKPSDFFPACDDLVFVKVTTTEETREAYQNKTKQTDCWCRAYRLTDKLLYCIDTDDFIPFLDLPKGHCETRRFFGEFSKVPRLCVQVNLKRKGKFVSIEKANRAFQRGNRYSFEIIKVQEDGSYDAEINLVKE